MQIFLAILMALTGASGLATVYDADTETEMAAGKTMLSAAGALLVAVVILGLAD